MFANYIFVDESTGLWVTSSCEEAGVDSLVDHHNGEFWAPSSIEFLDLANDLGELVVGDRLELTISNSISEDEDVVRLAATLTVVSLERLDA